MQPHKIQKLASNLANQIAAGEVVARPASVLKESLENSLDADSSKIDVLIADGGLELIEIRDNGFGIEKADLELAIKRHATSKISSLADLEAVASFGFRGEALAAISSVSNFELISRARGTERAWRLSFDPSSAQTKILQHPHPEGTSLIVKNLFFNTPARRKFLRTPRTEFSHIEKSMRNFALAFPQISFSFKHNGKLIWDLYTQNLAERCKKIMGENFIDKSLVINSNLGNLQLKGFVGLPQIAKSTRDSQHFFVNNRAVSDRLVSHAIKQAYADIMYANKQPAFVLFLQIPAESVDVNVHPTKNEVRFRAQNQIHSFIYSSLHKELSKPLAGRSYNLDPNFQAKKLAHNPNIFTDQVPSSDTIYGAANFNSNKNFLNEDALTEYENLTNINTQAPLEFGLQGSNSSITEAKNTSLNLTDKPAFAQAQAGSNLIIPLDENLQTDIFAEKYADAAKNIQQELTHKLAIPPMGFALAQIKKTFILAENAQGLLIVDMHAAHERIIYEELKIQLAQDKLLTQNLLFPLELDLEETLVETAEEHLQLLKSLGLGLSVLSPQKIGLNFFPSILQQNNAEALLTEVLQELHNFGTHKSVQINMERSLVSMSCQGAWRTGKELNVQQMNYLLRQMEVTPNSDECCHGRLTWKQFSLKELNSFFKRGQ